MPPHSTTCSTRDAASVTAHVPSSAPATARHARRRCLAVRGRPRTACGSRPQLRSRARSAAGREPRVPTDRFSPQRLAHCCLDLAQGAAGVASMAARHGPVTYSTPPRSTRCSKRGAASVTAHVRSGHSCESLETHFGDAWSLRVMRPAYRDTRNAGPADVPSGWPVPHNSGLDVATVAGRGTFFTCPGTACSLGCLEQVAEDSMPRRAQPQQQRTKLPMSNPRVDSIE